MGIVGLNEKADTGEKTVEKKTAPKKVAPRKTTAEKQAEQATKLAQEVMDGLWGPKGRDQDNRLRDAGHDVDAVRREVIRLRGQAAVDSQTDLQRAQAANLANS